MACGSSLQDVMLLVRCGMLLLVPGGRLLLLLLLWCGGDDNADVLLTRLR
jgi:hypothetical protein